jgi:hypothetical protein|tara:strand:+ start:1038 stop:1217 length:180 start_codon:yes stop_codon:yes gene_type:complete
MSSSQVNLSGFNVGENNIATGQRLNGEARKIVLSITASEKKDRDARLKNYFRGSNHAHS